MILKSYNIQIIETKLVYLLDFDPKGSSVAADFYILHIFSDTEKSWTAHSVELTLWTYYVAKTMDLSILKSVEKRKSDSCDSGPATKKKKT